MRKIGFVTGMLVAEGALLIAVAVIHLAMTEEIGQIVAHNTSAKAFAFLWPPYALDHVVVGVLLLPIGASTILCAFALGRGDALAWRILCFNALSVLALPVALIATIGSSYLQSSPPFLVAAILVTAIGLSMIWPILWTRWRMVAPHMR